MLLHIGLRQGHRKVEFASSRLRFGLWMMLFQYNACGLEPVELLFSCLYNYLWYAKAFPSDDRKCPRFERVEVMAVVVGVASVACIMWFEL